MKRFVLAFVSLALLCCCQPVFAAGEGGKFAKTANGENIPGAAWNGAKAMALTVASTIVDMSKDLAYKVYTATDCYERWMPLSTSTKANYVKTPIISGEWSGAAVNRDTPFANFSGCTGGFVKRH